MVTASVSYVRMWIMVWNCTHSEYKRKQYMLVSERYIWADGRVVINNNGHDLINSAGILDIHFLWWGYVYKFEISCLRKSVFIKPYSSLFFAISISIHSNLCGKGSCFLNGLFRLHILILSCVLYKSQPSSQKDSPRTSD